MITAAARAQGLIGRLAKMHPLTPHDRAELESLATSAIRAAIEDELHAIALLCHERSAKSANSRESAALLDLAQTVLRRATARECL